MRTLAVTAALLLSLPAGAATVKHTFESRQDAGSVRRVLVDIPEAVIAIENGTGPGIIVTGTASREVRREKHLPRYQKVVDDIGVAIAIDGTRAVITRRDGPGAQNRAGKSAENKLALRVVLPPGVHLDVRQRAGETQVTGEWGDVDIRLTAGELTLRTPRRNVRELEARTRVGEVTTNLGDRTIINEGLLPPKTHFFNEGGHSRVYIRVGVGDANIELTN